MKSEHNGGAAAQKLWCVELVPKLEKILPKNKGTIEWLAKGLPENEEEAIKWTMTVVGGLEDHRVPIFLRVGRRLVVFKERKKASKTARDNIDEYWSAKVREVRVL